MKKRIDTGLWSRRARTRTHTYTHACTQTLPDNSTKIARQIEILPGVVPHPAIVNEDTMSRCIMHNVHFRQRINARCIRALHTYNRTAVLFLFRRDSSPSLY